MKETEKKNKPVEMKDIKIDKMESDRMDRFYEQRGWQLSGMPKP